ncbi:Fido, protein-threonine AMPylation domain-containing protein [Eubacterium callanderi]|uniref:Fic/DOC family protein n=3 Tax=Eubacterium callanderi TaxID=53442 RepID=UPI0008ED3D80|nr:Fic family protein [Eubacterium callanderi]SFP54891.1 Fido, protein-threonine AMPylation domain-containing protein [Eubacterium callanderi]
MEEHIPYTYEEKHESYDTCEKQLYWDVAIGLNQVDALKPSQYLKKLIPKNIYGAASNKEVEDSLKAYYREKSVVNHDEMECDLVSARIVSLLETGGFSFSPVALKSIHRILFDSIYDFNGIFRDTNIWKKEPILGGESVTYGDFRMLEDTLDYDFAQEKKQNYVSMDNESAIRRISEFINSIWQVHPFREGNTRTIAVFLIQYLNHLGFSVNNEPFKEGSLYFRNALVRANYYNMDERIQPTSEYLEKFLTTVLSGDTVKDLDSWEMAVSIGENKEKDEYEADR